MEPIHNRQNRRIKFIKKLHQKKYRDKESLFIMEGNRCLRELISTGYPIHTLVYASGVTDRKTMILIEVLSRQAEHTLAVTADIMNYISPARSSQQILGVLQQKKWTKQDFLKTDKYFLGLYSISDPGNLGTIIRSSQAFNCGGVFMIGDCVDLFNPQVVRASAGYILDVPVIGFTSLESFFKFTGKNNFKTICMTTETDNYFLPLKDEKRLVYVFGGETMGFDENELAKFHKRQKIDMKTGVDSLNLSITASIVLYEFYKNQ
ncbi:MAG: TrmH family RNA methyltransferase [Vulcanimicrobiota bacterium]